MARVTKTSGEKTRLSNDTRYRKLSQPSTTAPKKVSVKVPKLDMSLSKQTMGDTQHVAFVDETEKSTDPTMEALRGL